MSRALELHGRRQGWKYFSVRTTSISGALMNTWICTFDKQGGREGGSGPVIALVNWAPKIHQSWKHWSWTLLSHIGCSFLGPCQIHPAKRSEDSGLKLPEDYPVPVTPPKALKHLSSQNKTQLQTCRNCFITIPLKSSLFGKKQAWQLLRPVQILVLRKITHA